MDDKKLTAAREHEFHAGSDPQGLPHVRGLDPNDGVDVRKIIDAYATTGAQATNLARAIGICRAMRADEDCTVYLGYTSNQVSTGNRELIRWLVEQKEADVLVTTAGGVEEDIIKCLGPFYVASFEQDGARLREQGLNRIGNLLVPNDRYAAFERFLTPILTAMLAEQQATGVTHTPGDLIWRLGAAIDNDASIYTWAWRNRIPCFCPVITDGSIGDIIFFFEHQHPGFKLDLVAETKRFHTITLDAKKTGALILGAGLVKHMILNSNMLRNGMDYCVYVNTAAEFDASDSGARPDEAVSWGKLLPDARSVKVFADTTIVLPLIIAGAFQDHT